MKKTRLIMGMPITVEVVDKTTPADFEDIFEWFTVVDKRFSTYKKNSEISKINRGLAEKEWSPEVRQIMKLARQTKLETGGYFDIQRNGKIDPSGLVKGWSVNEAAKQLIKRGNNNFYIEAGGDIAVSGKSREGNPWLVGIRNPFKIDEIIKVISVTDCGVATSGTYIRGEHVYNPLENCRPVNEINSLTVIGPNIYDADRYATGAFAMGQLGINFIEGLDGFEGYVVDNQGVATFTSGFNNYVAADT